MNFEIIATSLFTKELKSLAKKYPGIKGDIQKLSKELQDKPQLGTPLPKGCFKIRLQITGKLSGKSGGARVITFVKVIDWKIYLLSIYDKAEQSDNQALDILLKSL